MDGAGQPAGTSTATEPSARPWFPAVYVNAIVLPVDDAGRAVVAVEIEPVDRIEDGNWTWFIGLDAEATRIGNALWTGDDPDEGAAERIVALFRLDFADPREAPPDVGAGPVWLILAMTPDRLVRMKPQNLGAGLPVRTGAAAN